jgi:hypothetical protein
MKGLCHFIEAAEELVAGNETDPRLLSVKK